jgi:hypothetical protein
VADPKRLDAGKFGAGSFDAGEFGPDGTQPLPTPPVWPDPLAGLVSAENFTWMDRSPQVVAPPKVQGPDPEALREAIEAEMLRERRPSERRASRARPPTPRRPVRPAPVPQQAQAKSRSASLGGCLIALLILGGVFFNVLRAVFEELVKLFH